MASDIWSSAQSSWSMSVIKHPPTHGMVGVDSLLHLPALLSLEYNSVFCLLGWWVISSMLRGHQSLRWQLTSSPESKRHFGGSIGVGNHFFPRRYLFYWLSYHIALLPSCIDGKGEAPFCKSAPPLFAVLCFPMLWQKHNLYTVYLYWVDWILRVHNSHKGLEIWFSARTKSW